jgi:phage FluMu protein gp41
MAGMFYAAARHDMTYRMLEKHDSLATRFASEWVTETAPVAAAVAGPESRGTLLARLLRSALKPAARPKETAA